MEKIPKEVSRLIEFGIKQRHNLLNPEKLVAEASREIGLSEEETREELQKYYRKVFDGFLEKL